MNGNGNSEEELVDEPGSKENKVTPGAKKSAEIVVAKVVGREGIEACDEDELLRDNETEVGLNGKDLPEDIEDLNPADLLTDEEESPEIEALTDDENEKETLTDDDNRVAESALTEDEDDSAVSLVDVHGGDDNAHSVDEEENDPLAEQNGDLSCDNSNVPIIDEIESQSGAVSNSTFEIDDTSQNSSAKEKQNTEEVEGGDSDMKNLDEKKDSLGAGDDSEPRVNQSSDLTKDLPWDKAEGDTNESQNQSDSTSKEPSDETKTSVEVANSSEDEDDMPRIRMKSDIFEAENDDEDEDCENEGMDPDALEGMMEVEMGEGDPNSKNSTPKRKSTEASSDNTPLRRNPRRQAAVVASNTIKEITNLEDEEPDLISKGKDNDVEYVETVNSQSSSNTSSGIRTHTSRPSLGSDKQAGGGRQHCHQCKQVAPSLIVVRQYGTDIHLCSNKCFNSFRNPDPTFRPLPCAKCGVLHRDNDNTKLYFWETMNFCSDLCVGNFQFKIGFYCSTCSKRTPWNCLGKYCVRFGSDIRQFCTAACLETYKRNARVCFHCQLDIKKLGNVVLANIPSKPTPKEFCSQECVDQYIDQNVPSVNRVKVVPSVSCHVCKVFRPLHKELMTAIMSYKVCSANCWERLLQLQSIRTPTKCEACTKHINMDTITISPSFYVATEKKAYGFCSATCKNVFVLKTRQIRPCTSCQVKKYNYDLIQYHGAKTNSFAVCSLNCIPKQSSFILSLKNKLLDPSYVPPNMSSFHTSHIVATKSTVTVTNTTTTTSLTHASSDGVTGSVRNGEVSAALDDYRIQADDTIQIEGVTSLADSSFLVNGDGSVEYENLDSRYSVVAEDGVTLRPATDSEIIQFRDYDYTEADLVAATEVDLAAMDLAATTGTTIEAETEGWQAGMGDTDGEDGLAEEASLEDIDKWANVEDLVIIRYPEPVAQRNKGCQVKPYPNEVETQTDFAELADMPRIQPKVRVLIVPVPVLIPFPVYSCERPVPVPFPYPVGVPIPIPIPIISETLQKSSANANTTSGPFENIVDSNFLKSVQSPLKVLEFETEPIDDVEMMDTSEPPEMETIEPSEVDGLSQPVTASTSSAFTFGSSNSPMSVGSPSVPSANTFFSSSNSPAPGSPSLGGKWKVGRVEYGLRAWKLFFGDEDPVNLTPEVLSGKLIDWTLRGTKPKGDRYEPDVLFYFFLGIQQHLRAGSRPDQLFYDHVYSPFVETFTAYAEQEMSRGRCIAKVEEDHVWEANELGPNTPGVLLFTLVYFVYKNFGIKTWEEHGALDFSQVQIHSREIEDGASEEKYITIAGVKNTDEELIELSEEPSTPHRCPVKLLEFYKSKCESTQGSLYRSIKPLPEPKSAWFSVEPLSQMDLYRMLVRAQMICFTSIDD